MPQNGFRIAGAKQIDINIQEIILDFLDTTTSQAQRAPEYWSHDLPHKHPRKILPH